MISKTIRMYTYKIRATSVGISCVIDYFQGSYVASYAKSVHELLKFSFLPVINQYDCTCTPPCCINLW